MPFRSGFVSIIGRPNAGKSTLLNALLGQKLAIVTHKPQTTRTRIHGVLEVPLKKKTKGEAGHPAAQVVLVDTPGVHKPETQLDRRMMQEVQDALESRDAVLFIVDVTHRLARPEAPGEKIKATGRMAMSAAEDDFALSLVKRLDCPVILVLNKIDAVRKEELLPLIAHWSAQHTLRRRRSHLRAQEGGTRPAAGQDRRDPSRGPALLSSRSGDGPARAVSGSRTDSRKDPDADRRGGPLRNGGGDRAVRRAGLN